MADAVDLVRAYLHVNGYFSVSDCLSLSPVLLEPVAVSRERRAEQRYGFPGPSVATQARPAEVAYDHQSDE